jgi:hypothetical protein
LRREEQPRNAQQFRDFQQELAAAHIKTARAFIVPPVTPGG